MGALPLYLPDPHVVLLSPDLCLTSVMGEGVRVPLSGVGAPSFPLLLSHKIGGGKGRVPFRPHDSTLATFSYKS